MSLLAAERIKLFSTRAPWWCTLIAVTSSLGFTVLFVTLGSDEFEITVASTQVAASFGRTVILVLAVLAATTEFAWGTMRTTFQAVPSRTPALLAKAVVVGGWSVLVGLVIGFGAWTLGLLLGPDADLALATGADWRAVAGQGLLFGLTAVLGLGVGMLTRNTGFAIAVVLVWTQLVEGLVFLIPGIGDDVYQWMPFFAASQFTGGDFTTSALNLGELPLGPIGYGAYFAGICVFFFTAGVLAIRQRDS